MLSTLSAILTARAKDIAISRDGIHTRYAAMCADCPTVFDSRNKFCTQCGGSTFHFLSTIHNQKGTRA